MPKRLNTGTEISQREKRRKALHNCLSHENGDGDAVDHKHDDDNDCGVHDDVHDCS